ncbi:MAG: hypothetical protein EXR75_15425 [Myxococcales bacterium]|nr:hypothetical protein [Myxococcales bacterium]
MFVNRVRRPLLRFAVVWVTSVVAASCTLGEFHRAEDLTGSGGAGGTTSSSTATGPADGCEHASYPSRPAGRDLGGATEFISAVRTIHFAVMPDGTPVGVDLDQMCSCFEDAPSTCAPTKNSLQVKSYCDTAGGRDNAVGRLLKQASALLTTIEIDEFYSQQAELGYWGQLVRVSGYNGAADDDQVTVALIGTGQFGINPPNWDGNDAWPVSSQAFEDDGKGMPDLTKPRYLDVAAYVSDHVLVASIPDTKLELAGQQSRVALQSSGGGIMATLEKSALGWNIKAGVITGRMGDEQVFEMIASYRNNEGEPLCTDDAFYCAAKNAFCDGLDISADGVGNPAQPCNALSFGVGFTAVSAKLGAVVIPAATTQFCPPGKDTSIDSCFKLACPP